MCQFPQGRGSQNALGHPPSRQWTPGSHALLPPTPAHPPSSDARAPPGHVPPRVRQSSPGRPSPGPEPRPPGDPGACFPLWSQKCHLCGVLAAPGRRSDAARGSGRQDRTRGTGAGTNADSLGAQRQIRTSSRALLASRSRAEQGHTSLVRLLPRCCTLSAATTQ